MKVCVTPIGLHSRAMIRVAEALTKYAPPNVTCVPRPGNADVLVLHTIGPDVLRLDLPREYVVIQYCYQTAGANREPWQEFWSKSRFVWSYYDLDVKGAPFYHAPLGVNKEIFQIKNTGCRKAVLTSGFVSGPGAEPIEDMACAAESLNMPIVHIGPEYVENMRHYPRQFSSYLNISDEQLVALYNTSCYVSGMRYVEGFEMPVIEGLACGSRPICFDRPDMRQWYDGHVVYVPEYSGPALQGVLKEVLQSKPEKVTDAERESVIAQFSWPEIAHGFWQHMNV